MRYFTYIFGNSQVVLVVEYKLFVIYLRINFQLQNHECWIKIRKTHFNINPDSKTGVLVVIFSYYNTFLFHEDKLPSWRLLLINRTWPILTMEILQASGEAENALVDAFVNWILSYSKAFRLIDLICFWIKHYLIIVFIVIQGSFSR